MDDGGHRENGRHKQDQYKAVHNQWMIPQHHMKEHHASMMKQMMTIMAERDAAIQERNMALAKEKAALAERDMAILQRDAAISERNNALVERENAIAALEYRENAMNGNGASACPPGCGLPRGTKHVHHPQHSNRSPHLPEGSYNTREMHVSEAFPISEASPVSVKHRRVKERKETEAVPLPLKKTSKRKGKRGGEDLNKQIIIAKEEWDNGQDIGGDGGHLVKSEWRGQELGLNEVAFDESTMPVPVCSCTGEFKQCYKWGNGGWQSSCCTTTISMYPLPVMANRRHARVGGRKMSGGVFNKLLSRLAAEGHDLSTPLDLKDHWAKHGTNRYITIK